MDYTELVKELRETPANKRLMIYAAEAIEALSKELMELKMLTYCCCEPKEETE